MGDRVKMVTVPEGDGASKGTRRRAQVLSYAQLNELIGRNVSKGARHAYTQFAKESVKQYLSAPDVNLDNIREVSRFLERNSALYRKILTYYAATPLFYYNLVPSGDFSGLADGSAAVRDFCGAARLVGGFDFKRDLYNAIYCTVRDGMYVGFVYGGGGHRFFMPLDVKFCRIYGKNARGEWIVYFNASFFSGNNSIFVEGVGGDMSGCWDECFVEGYRAYRERGISALWFRLPPERTFCMIAGADDQFDVPLPLFAGLFVSCMDLQDMEQILADRTELENYKLLVSKIPLVKGSSDVDDFAISMEFVNQMQELIDAAVPPLVGTAVSPMELEAISFDRSNSTEGTDRLAQSVQNLFNNAGVSQIVVAGGLSGNSVGLRHALENDLSNIWLYVNRIESWLNFYISENISDGYSLYFHHISWFNREDYIREKREAATLGGSALDYLTALGDTPFAAWQKLNFEECIGVKGLMKPLVSGFNVSSGGGAPRKDEDELSLEGLDTRAADKNGTERD